MHLTDADHVRGLLAAYGELLDAADFAGLGQLLADAVLADESGTPFATGAAEVAGFYGATVRLHADGTPRTHHLVLGTRFLPEDAPDRAGCRSSYLVLHQPDGGALAPMVTGTYDDTFARSGPPGESGGWRFVERRMGLRLVGDLSTHLAFDPT